MIKKNWWRENNVLRFDFPLQLNNRFSQFSFLSLSLPPPLAGIFSLRSPPRQRSLLSLQFFDKLEIKKKIIFQWIWGSTDSLLVIVCICRNFISQIKVSLFLFIYYLFWNFSWFYSLILFNSPQIIKKMNKKNVISE